MRLLPVTLLLGAVIFVSTKSTCRTRTKPPSTVPMNEVTEAVTTKKASNVTVKPTTCEASWTRVERSIGGWCLKVYNGFVHQDQASQACIRIGAELSGSESSAERAVIARLGKERMLAASDYKFGTIRVGIARPTTTRVSFSRKNMKINLKLSFDRVVLK